MSLPTLATALALGVTARPLDVAALPSAITEILPQAGDPAALAMGAAAAEAVLASARVKTM